MNFEYRGKKFGWVYEASEYTQSCYYTFYFDKEGEYQIPEWPENDIRWEETGIVLLKDTLKFITNKEYDMMPRHFEDDWLDWEDLCLALEDESD